MRLFVGVWPSDEARRQLAALERPRIDGVRWTTPEQWHVTLAFLGEVDDQVVGTVSTQVAAVARVLGPAIEAVAGPATQLLGPSVLCVPVAGLDTAAGELGRALRAAGVAVEERRRYRGHVTLARGRGGRPLPRQLAGAPVHAGWPVDAIELLRSTLDPAGARYETVLRATVPA